MILLLNEQKRKELTDVRHKRYLTHGRLNIFLNINMIVNVRPGLTHLKITARAIKIIVMVQARWVSTHIS